MTWLGVTASTLALFVASCASLNEPETTSAGGRTKVIATTSILGDVLVELGGDQIELTTLIPRGADPHDFVPSAQQVATISAADLIVANGLGLEASLNDLLEQADSEGLFLLTVAEDANPIAGDPHFWQDPERMKEAVQNITTALAILDVEGSVDRKRTYLAELDQLIAEVEKTLAPIPADRRILVTNHGAFNYFADRFGFEVLGTVIPGGGTLASPSSAELAALIDLIEEHSVPAIFVENTASPDLAESIAAEVGRPVQIVELASDALGEPGSDTSTYLGLIRFNARAIVDALAG